MVCCAMLCYVVTCCVIWFGVVVLSVGLCYAILRCFVF